MLEKLGAMAESYLKVKPEEFAGDVNLEIGEQGFTLALGPDTAEVKEGLSEEPQLTVVLDESTFKKLELGVWNGLTAAGRESMDQPAPLDFRLPEGRSFDELKELIYHLGMHFFKRRYPHVYRFGASNAREVHGGEAVALAYGHGVRFAYYFVRSGQQLNEDEDTNPFEQVLSVIGGQGTAVIDGVEVPLERGTVVHVPAGKTHVVKADQPTNLELLWLAYGPGA